MADTIYALSSGNVPSGLAVIRLSGPNALVIGEKIANGLPAARTNKLCNLVDPESGELIDRALVLTFSQPSSFTGENVVEFHCHGSRPVVSKMFDVLDRFGSCRMADAGEFTRRAFENGKMDLTEIEGLSDLIAAETEAQRVLALRQAGGELRELYEGWRKDLIRCRALIEAELDFADEEDVPGSVSDQVWSQVDVLRSEIEVHLDDDRQGEIVRDGLRVVLTGAPNVGKSSLLNALARRDVAIVTPIAGTTRDAIDVDLDLAGFKVRVTDTAGLRESDDLVEQEGILRAQQAIDQADVVLWLQVPGDTNSVQPPRGAIPVWTKSDLVKPDTGKDLLTINTVSRDGLDPLLNYLEDRLRTLHSAVETPVMTRQRHRLLLVNCLECLSKARMPNNDLEIGSEHC